MHLKNLTLTNFRCFDQLTLDFDERLTVLVAENGGGKTSILDAIALGLAEMIRTYDSAEQRLDNEEVGKLPSVKDTDFSILPTGGVAEQLKVSLTDTNENVWTAEAFSKVSRPRDHKPSPMTPPLPVVAYYGATRGYIEVPDRLHESSINYDAPSSCYVGALDPRTDFKEAMKWFDREEASELRAQRQNEGISSPALDLVRPAIVELLGGDYSAPFFNERHKFVVHLKGKGAEAIQVVQLSHGYQSMLALGIDFARRLALAGHRLDGQPAPSLMLIDEVDLHLHPRWQQRVLEDLIHAFPYTQFVVSTHSPQVLSTVDRRCIRVIRQDLDGPWSADSPADQPAGAASSFALSHIMGVDPVPHRVKEAIWLQRYVDLIEDGLGDENEAKDLRSKLLSSYGETHPTMINADRLKRFQEFKRRKTNS